MMLKRTALTLLILSLCSCASGNRSSASSSGSANKPQAGSQGYNFPKDAQVTIFCARVQGSDHVLRAKRDRDAMIQSTGMKDWYVINEEDQSLLYYGFYRSIEEPRAQQDRQKILGMADNMGNRPFSRALFVELTSPDPAAPPEWNLVNAKGEWTLQIAVYKGSPQRKEAAVDSVREARAKGIEAYYYHGDTASLVCIGAWPEGAIKIIDDSASVKNTDPNQILIYAPMTDDPQVNQEMEEQAKQANAKLIRQQYQILDPDIESKRTMFPYNSINGEYLKNAKGGIDRSFPLHIPHMKKASPQYDASAAPNPNQPQYDPNYRPSIPSQTTQQPQLPSQQQPQQPGVGRLRSIGD